MAPKTILRLEAVFVYQPVTRRFHVSNNLLYRKCSIVQNLFRCRPL